MAKPNQAAKTAAKKQAAKPLTNPSATAAAKKQANSADPAKKSEEKKEPIHNDAGEVAPALTEKELAQGMTGNRKALYVHYIDTANRKNVKNPITEKSFYKKLDTDGEVLALGYLYSEI